MHARHLFDEMSLRRCVSLLKLKWDSFIAQSVCTQHRFCSLHSTVNNGAAVSKLCEVISCTIGGLDELESSLNKCTISLTSSLVTQVIDSSKNEAPTRRLLRFFLWSLKKLNHTLEDEDFNNAIRFFAQKKDYTAVNILLSNLKKADRAMDGQTFGFVAEAFVKMDREDEALGLFKNLEKYKCPHDQFTVVAIITALCSKGHAKRAEGVVLHHKDKISSTMSCIYRSLLYGWSIKKNTKEARRILKEMKSDGTMPDLFCYNTFLKCLCEKNVEKNPSGLVPESLNVMMEMRSYKISPNSISYNILLSCLCKTRRVKESCKILEMMKRTGCQPDCVSYYLMARVLFLTGRFGKGREIVDEMIEEGLTPDRKFYYDLIGILCGVERTNYALELFEKMKRSSLGGYGPVYDVLIPKLCRGGEFEMGRQLWEEAMAMGVSLNCSSEILDPSITKVFKPTRKIENKIVEEFNSAEKQNKAAAEKPKEKRKKGK
ncbi:pentatricopeptide repeat-containing protein At5g61370, mitochondrial [Cucumis sativus]|uniref:Pentacotripeptide-repeat region of PRORP domain-containing protein n=1 Tax=Cucumis sativus TaxID=3659 RepID=A0A0A0LPF4_CUCSA|nr:pentatricopeptide repeat-containing protein At5g61370, mitochondrial [Cucumis sativus]